MVLWAIVFVSALCLVDLPLSLYSKPTRPIQTMAKKVIFILLILSIPTGFIVAYVAKRQGASFDYWVNNGRRKRRIEAGYQDLYNDKGNWTGGAIGNGQLIGTNRSISAIALSDYLGRTATLSNMKNLSIQTAHKIYYKKYWLPIQGDQIKSQLMAGFIADMRSSAGYNGIRELQKALIALGENLKITKKVDDATLAAINRQIRLSEKRLNNAYHDQMVSYYNSIGHGTNSQFLKNWIQSLEKDYPKL